MKIDAISRALEGGSVGETLLEQGYVIVRSLLDAKDCNALRSTFEDSTKFRQHIVMDKHGYGKGDYKYFCYPLPEIVKTIRESFYEGLYRVANEWNDLLSVEFRYPSKLLFFLEACRDNGQYRPTPLILRYETGGYNRMHQDVYGAISFPFQVVILLSRPGEDFQGGEFLLSEQRPRQQARIRVLDLEEGDAVIIPSSTKPYKLKTKTGRASVKHGIGTVSIGERFTLGVVFHDSK